MTEFVVELYLPRSAEGLDRDAEEARLVAEQMTREGTPVTYVRSIFVPEDETCFHLYEASTADDVREAATRAALAFDRVAEVAHTPGVSSPCAGDDPKGDSNGDGR